MNSGTAILRRLIDPEKDDVTPETARYFLRLDFKQQEHERMERLSAKASEGKLTAKERAELEKYLRVGDLLALMQSKARQALQRA